MAADLLVLSFYYPPFPGVGARRWGFLSRFLTERGIRVTVVTSPLSGCRDQETNPAVRVVPAPQGKTPHVPRLPFLEEWLRWRRPFGEVLPRIIEREQPRLLAFTGGPFFSFVAATALSARFSMPYWLDFRDPWVLGSHTQLRLTAPWMHCLERRAVAGARLVTDVTPEMADLRRAHFPHLPPERFQVLENGFDGEPPVPEPPVNRREFPLRIGLWGKFSPYQPDHPDLLVSALAAAMGSRAEIHHCGDAEIEKPLAEAASRAGWAGTLRFHGFLEYEAGSALMAKMDLLAVNHRSPLMVGTKVYDAIRLNRPVLALCRPDDALARLLRSFRHAYRVADPAEIAAALGEIARSRPGCLDPDLDPSPYSRRSRAEAFLPLLAPLLAPS